MSDLISRKYLYDKMLEKEELARQRVLDTPTHSPAYLRYVAQLNERTALKHEIADAPTVEAVPVVRCINCQHWGTGVTGETEHVKCCEYAKYMVGEDGYCCYGADMRKKV